MAAIQGYLLIASSKNPVSTQLKNAFGTTDFDGLENGSFMINKKLKVGIVVMSYSYFDNLNTQMLKRELDYYKTVYQLKSIKKTLPKFTDKNETIEYVNFGSAYYLTTDAVLKGSGINLAGDGSDHKRGKKTYHVTPAAFKRLKTKFNMVVNTKSF